MGFDRKLTAWQEAGLIDAETVSRIRRHEEGNSRPLVLYAVGGVGAVAIVLGLIAIIAANWGEISSPVKLLLDLLIGVVLAFCLLRSRPGWTREYLLVVYSGYVIGSIGLIGQIYHLESASWHALLAWSVCTFPVMLWIEKPFAATFWLSSLVITHVAVLVGLAEWMLHANRLGDRAVGDFLTLAVSCSPLPYLLFARSSFVRRSRVTVSEIFWIGGWLAIALLAFGCSSLFYVSTVGETDLPRIGVFLAFFVWSGIAAYLPRLDSSLSSRTLLGMRGLLVGGALIGLLSIQVERESWPVVGAVLQIILLAAMAWTSLQAGSVLGFRVGTAAVCLRLLIVYIEVFGSMLETGLGLIGGGVFAMLLAGWWWRRSSQLEETLRWESTGQGEHG